MTPAQQGGQESCDDQNKYCKTEIFKYVQVGFLILVAQQFARKMVHGERGRHLDESNLL